MLKHLRLFHPEAAPERKLPSNQNTKEFVCCGQRFQSSREVWSHRMIHHYAKLRDGTGKYYPQADFPSEPSRSNDVTNSINDEHDRVSPACNNLMDDNVPESSIVDSDNNTQEPPKPAADNLNDLIEILNGADAEQLFTKVGATIVDRSGKKRFRTIRRRQSFCLTPTGLGLCGNGFVMEVMTMVIDELLKKYKEKGGLMQIKLLADSLNPPIVTPLFETHLFSSLMLLNYIENVLSSKDKFALDETLTFDVIHVEDVQGSGRLNAPDVDSYIRRRTGSWDPMNSHDDFRCLRFCLAASILIEQRQAKGQQFTRHKFYKEPQQSPELNVLTQKLYTQSGVDSTRPCGIPELDKFQTIFNEQYGMKQLIVFDWENNYSKLYVGKRERSEGERIYLLLFKSHFYLLWGIRSFLGNTYKLCTQCTTVYNTKKRHLCEGVCPHCLRDGCPALTSELCNDIIECQRCYLVFRNADCYSAHEETVCLTRRYKCTKCLQTVETSKAHGCGKGSKCKHCYQVVDLSTHRCEVQIPSERTRLGSSTFNVVHFDVKTGTNSESRLVPYLICCSLNCDNA